MANDTPMSIEDRIAAAMAPEPMDAPEPVQPAQQPEPVMEVAEVEPEQIEAAPAPEQVDDVEEVEIGSLDELARHLEVDVADLYGVKFPVDIDGERVELSIGELKDVARERERVKKAQAEYERKKVEWQAQEQAMREQATRAHQERESVFNALEQEYLRDYANVDWSALEQQDPGRAALARQHFEMRRQNLLSMRANARLEMEHKEREFFTQLKQQEAARIQAEDALLAEKWPEWRDPVKRQEIGGKLANFLISEGYGEDQIYGRRLPDGERVGGLSARDILLARDAMAWRELQANSKVAKQKVVKLGKRVLTSGPRPSAGEQAQRAESTLRARLKKSGNVNDAAALIQARLGR